MKVLLDISFRIYYLEIAVIANVTCTREYDFDFHISTQLDKYIHFAQMQATLPCQLKGKL